MITLAWLDLISFVAASTAASPASARPRSRRADVDRFTRPSCLQRRVLQVDGDLDGRSRFAAVGGEVAGERQDVTDAQGNEHDAGCDRPRCDGVARPRDRDRGRDRRRHHDRLHRNEHSDSPLPHGTSFAARSAECRNTDRYFASAQVPDYAPHRAAADTTAVDSLHAASGRVGEVIRRLRRQRGLSVRGLAEQAGISASFLGAVERGDSDIALGRLAQVAGSLDHDVASLLGYSLRQAAPRTSSTRRATYEARRGGEGVDFAAFRVPGTTSRAPRRRASSRGRSSTTSSRTPGIDVMYVARGRARPRRRRRGLSTARGRVRGLAVLAHAHDAQRLRPACRRRRVHDRDRLLMTEMRLYDLRVTVERIEGRSVCGLAGRRLLRSRRSRAGSASPRAALLPLRAPGGAAADCRRSSGSFPRRTGSSRTPSSAAPIPTSA